MKCTKAIIPVAGYGTRRLPITKAIEKCMLPVGNRPTVDYVVEDLVHAGVTEIIFVVSGEGQQLREYYRRDQRLEAYLRGKGKEAFIPCITPPAGITFRFVTQPLDDGKYGSSVPVWLCRQYIEVNESVFVFMGDDFLYSIDGTSEAARLVAATGEDEAALLGAPVSREVVSRYGVIEMNEREEYVTIQEKPTPDEAKSTLINISKYLLPSTFWRYLEDDMGRNHDGQEYQLVDALNAFAADNHVVHVVAAKGVYCDSGNTVDWLRANQLVIGSSEQ